MKTLIITNTNDGTTDLLINLLPKGSIFRLNYDRWFDYKINLSNGEVQIKNKFHRIRASNIKKVYWRKPFANEFRFDKKQDRYLNREMQYIFKEIWNRFNLEGKAVLVSPEGVGRIGKMTQLLLAKKYFHVPKWEMVINNNKAFKSKFTVAKSLSSALFSTNKFLYTNEVSTENLDTSYPWFLEEKIAASHDLTVVYISGKCFAYTLERKTFAKYVDSRQKKFPTEGWDFFELDSIMENKITRYMKELGLEFGRIDFLMDSKKCYFLEVNPNGQYAWLDMDNRNGLIKKILEEISPFTKIFTRP